ncbi:hypothetical protein QQF64_035994 [Cirrhinus molitorella]|uniref:DDE Tnp4 domain-containing protein n=1 Tax=Cirrhinus molitorella TaxID=172907 RepID=A0ABR3NHB2_9TELE
MWPLMGPGVLGTEVQSSAEILVIFDQLLSLKPFVLFSFAQLILVTLAFSQLRLPGWIFGFCIGLYPGSAFWFLLLTAVCTSSDPCLSDYVFACCFGFVVFLTDLSFFSAAEVSCSRQLDRRRSEFWPISDWLTGCFLEECCLVVVVLPRHRRPESASELPPKMRGKLRPPKEDPFPGEAPIPKKKLQKFMRGKKYNVHAEANQKVKEAIMSSEAMTEFAQKQAARYDLLLPEDAGFLEGDEDEDTNTISQDDIADAVDITSGSKVDRKRQQRGEYHGLVWELRLDGVLFDELQGRVGPLITRADSVMRKAIGHAQRLAICLRYLATGDSFKTIAFSYRVGHSAVAGIVKDVASAIWAALVEDTMPVPKKEDWRAIADQFYARWNFPKCLGAIYGNMSSSFGESLRDGMLDLPPDAAIPGAEHRGPLPCVFVGDEAFPLTTNLLRPYPGHHIPPERRAFNYRLSHARLVIECAFGILCAHWRMYLRVIATSRRCTPTAEPASEAPSAPEGLRDAPRMGSNNASRRAIQLRDTYCAYFNQEGAVPWQPSA